MAATDHDKRFMLVALVLSMVALAVLVGDKLTNSEIANRRTFDLLELVFASIALVLGLVVIVQARRPPKTDEQVIDLRERLDGLVDLDDVEVNRAIDTRH